MRRVIFAFVAGVLVFPTLCRADEQSASVSSPWTVEETLERWEQASLAVQPVDDNERNQMNRLHGAPYTGHELAVALEFRGRVTAAKLQEQYEWTAIESSSEGIRLTGRPSEREERLFCPKFQVLIHAETFLPLSVEFFDRAGSLRAPSMLLLTEFHTGQDSREAERVQFARATDDAGSIRLASRELHPLRAAPAVGLHSGTEALSQTLQRWEFAMAAACPFEVTFFRLEGEERVPGERRVYGQLLVGDPKSIRLDFGTFAGPSKTWISNKTHVSHPDERLPSNTSQLTDPEAVVLHSFGPPTPQGGSPLHAFIQFVAMGRMDAIRTQYEVCLGEAIGKEIHLIAIPKNPPERTWFRAVHVLLDPDTYRPTALKVADATGTRETIYVIHRWSFPAAAEVRAAFSLAPPDPRRMARSADRDSVDQPAGGVQSPQ